MKRESGASPEQSRCCELHLPYKGIGLLITHATACIYNKVGRQVNRSKSEDLQNMKSFSPAFEERAQEGAQLIH